jgi:hypothetical protein
MQRRKTAEEACIKHEAGELTTVHAATAWRPVPVQRSTKKTELDCAKLDQRAWQVIQKKSKLPLRGRVWIVMGIGSAAKL